MIEIVGTVGIMTLIVSPIYLLLFRIQGRLTKLEKTVNGKMK